MLPFLILSGALYFIIQDGNFQTYNRAFITASITIAIFAINFSFLQLQNNKYKQLQNKISGQQLTFSIITLFVSLAPLITLAINETYVPTVSFIAIPILAYSSILLWQISYDTINPIFLINRNNKERKLKRFLRRFDKANQEKQLFLKKYDSTIPTETPMHDFGSSKFATISVKNDPFFRIRNICILSLENGDISVFIQAIESFFELIEKYLDYELKEKKDSRFKLYQHIENNLSSIFNKAIGTNEKTDFQNKLIETATIFFKKSSEKFLQTHELVRNLLGSQFKFSMKIVENGNISGAMIFTSTCRYLVQNGIINPPPKKENDFFMVHLPFLSGYIKELGSKAVVVNDSDFLYRCLEELGYLGCTGVKNNDVSTGKLALQYIVQLGRESRAKKMKCFWTHCALEPWEHAHERIWWLLSWVATLDESTHRHWLDIFETGYSRILGFKVELSSEEKDGKVGFRIKETNEKYVEGFSSDGYTKNVDYSDFNEIKELKLW
ncbi:hypothetical protein [Sunxiuqinia dokdonensis]|uniref:Uncharacterized protein n=1 Tax=Sunxiuqinia dokdonensis TaxID=1409788 RepID=A0A0L8VA68_9BACT|nr:hypothetical protein [Sunxiuqinia dokdonensis]KOH45351.1 hypothetical protein NC99_18690 [Sunxiuqinia dokdonensis]